MRATEKIIDALSQLLEGFGELKEQLQADVGEEAEDDSEAEGGESNSELDAALVTELRGAIEAAIENSDLSPEDFGEVIASMTEALEEIDPDIFEGASENAEYGDDEEIDDEDLDDYEDIDDEDLDDFDEEEEEEEEEPEEEEDDDDDDEDYRGKKKKKR